MGGGMGGGGGMGAMTVSGALSMAVWASVAATSPGVTDGEQPRAARATASTTERVATMGSVGAGVSEVGLVIARGTLARAG